MADEESTKGTEEQNVPAAAAEAPKETVDPARAAAKAEIRELKTERAKALEAKDSAALKKVQRKIHKLKRQLRKAAAA